MFYGDLAEKNSVVHLSDTDEKSFEEFMRFLYTDECDLTADNAVLVMYLAKKYMVPSLTLKCVNILKRSINAGNATTILEHAMHFDEKNLENSCWEFIKSNTKKVVVSKHFNDISQMTLAGVLKLDCVDVSEVELFRAVLNWSDLQCSKQGMEPTRENKRSVIGNAIYHLRFLAMSQYEFAVNVVTSELLTAEEIIPIYNKFSGIQSPDLKWKLSDKRSQARYYYCDPDMEVNYKKPSFNKNETEANYHFYRKPELQDETKKKKR